MYIERPRMKGDRLDIIPGINPALLAKLRKDGIDTFGDLSLLSAEELRRIAGPRMGKRIDAEGILAQAKKLASGRKPG
jgi:predicted flap endonuclease-1-like 5' DNA nuclease